MEQAASSCPNTKVSFWWKPDHREQKGNYQCPGIVLTALGNSPMSHHQTQNTSHRPASRMDARGAGCWWARIIQCTGPCMSSLQPLLQPRLHHWIHTGQDCLKGPCCDPAVGMIAPHKGLMPWVTMQEGNVEKFGARGLVKPLDLGLAQRQGKADGLTQPH